MTPNFSRFYGSMGKQLKHTLPVVRPKDGSSEPQSLFFRPLSNSSKDLFNSRSQGKKQNPETKPTKPNSGSQTKPLTYCSLECWDTAKAFSKEQEDYLNKVLEENEKDRSSGGSVY